MPGIPPPRKPSSILNLLKIAAYIGVAGSTSLLAMQWWSDRKLRNSKFYAKAVDQLLAYQPTVDLFGPPVSFGTPDIKSGRNDSTSIESEFSIPVRGSKNRGTLYIKATRGIELDADIDPIKHQNTTTAPPPPPPWKFREIEVSVDNRPGERVRIPVTESLQP